MTKSKREYVRAVKSASITDKKFKKLPITSKRIRQKIIHPMVVIADLRRGNLASLDRYLAKNGGIPDREVALELRKLISGSVQRTRFRLIVVEHPDSPKDLGGRPKKNDNGLSGRTIKIASRFRDLLENGLVESEAKKLLGNEFNIQPRSVNANLKKFDDLDKAQMFSEAETLRNRARLLEARAEALERLRASKKEQE